MTPNVPETSEDGDNPSKPDLSPQNEEEDRFGGQRHLRFRFKKKCPRKSPLQKIWKKQFGMSQEGRVRRPVARGSA